MSWQASVDRQLAARRLHELESRNRELIKIIQEMESRFAVVVNRRAHEALRDVPSWKDPAPQAGAPALHESKKRMIRMPGVRTWKDVRARKEFVLSAETRKRAARVAEIAEVLGENLGPQIGTNQAPTGNQQISNSEKAG